jgi:DNA polymerase-3 subunit epsilon
MREIVFDTETTGLDPYAGHRLVEIGCVELVNHVRTGKVFHKYINPQRDMPEEAYKVHGLSEEFLQDKPLFEDIADEFIDFVGNSVLIAHNAPFDMKFVNAQLDWVKKPIFPMDNVIDTLVIAKKKFPGARNNLDVLCQKFGVDNSSRTVHGALLDAELLAEVYLELIGGKEPALELLGKNKSNNENKSGGKTILEPKEFRKPRIFETPKDEAENHNEFVSNKIKDPIWNL